VVNHSRNPIKQLEHKIEVLFIVEIEEVKGPNFNKIFICFQHKRRRRHVNILDRGVGTCKM
jgi:hypothetical protein